MTLRQIRCYQVLGQQDTAAELITAANIQFAQPAVELTPEKIAEILEQLDASIKAGKIAPCPGLQEIEVMGLKE